jgi:hypothetical protein
MKPWAFLLFSLMSLIMILGVGLPFEIKVGTLQVVGGKLHFVTPSQGLATLSGAAFAATALCERIELCVQPTDRQSFRAQIPILFEPCKSEDLQVASQQCAGATLKLKVRSSDWIMTTVRRKN